MSNTIFEFQDSTIRHEIEVVNQPKQPSRHQVRPGRRLFLTADRSRLVEDGDPEARYLYCNERSCVPRDEFERLTQSEES